MKKLENISNKNPFSVPDGYFDKLPLAIQSKIEHTQPLKNTRPYFRYALQYALPGIALLVMAILVYRYEPTESAEQMLSSVSTEQLLAYLEDHNLTTDELLENLDFDDLSIDAIEQGVYATYPLDSLTLDFDSDTVTDELQNL